MFLRAIRLGGNLMKLLTSPFKWAALSCLYCLGLTQSVLADDIEVYFTPRQEAQSPVQ